MSLVYRLSPHVRACADGEWIVLLDLARNRYCDLARAHAPALAGVRGMSASHAGDGRAAAALLERRMIEPAESGARQQPNAPMRGRRLARLPAPLALARAAVWARNIVARGRLFAAVHLMERAKAAADERKAKESMRDAHERFARLRPWIPAPYVCLFDSLCLMRFLLHRGLAADLVFGVRARPFAAHCWVEAEGGILDEGGEDCAAFVEIMRV